MYPDMCSASLLKVKITLYDLSKHKVDISFKNALTSVSKFHKPKR